MLYLPYPVFVYQPLANYWCVEIAFTLNSFHFFQDPEVYSCYYPVDFHQRYINFFISIVITKAVLVLCYVVLKYTFSYFDSHGCCHHLYHNWLYGHIFFVPQDILLLSNLKVKCHKILWSWSPKHLDPLIKVKIK